MNIKRRYLMQMTGLIGMACMSKSYSAQIIESSPPLRTLSEPLNQCVVGLVTYGGWLISLNDKLLLIKTNPF